MSGICIRRRLLIIFSLIILTIAGSTFVSHAGVAGNASGVVDSTDGVTVRSSYSTSSEPVTVLPDNTKVTIISEIFTSKTSTSKSSKWYRITCGDVAGYIRSDLIDNVSYTKGKAITTGAPGIRKGPDMSFDKTGSYEACTDFDVYLKAYFKDGGLYYKVKSDGKYGYVSSKYACARGTSKYNYGIGSVKTSYTYLRSSYSADSSKICKIKNGQKMVLLSQIYADVDNISLKTKWYKVRYNTKTGYVRADKVSFKYFPVDYHTKKTTNLKQGPATSCKTRHKLQENSNVRVDLKTKRPDGPSYYKVYYKGAYHEIYYKNLEPGHVENTGSEPGTDTENDTEKLEKVYKEELSKFPESYQVLLKSLHKDHPNWVFKAKNLSYSWSKAIDKQFKVHRYNLVPNNFPAAKKAVYEDTYNFSDHTYIGYDGPTWVCASLSCLRFYMDPRNWLNDLGIFMFESIQYDPAVHTESAVKSILESSGVPVSNAKYYVQAAEKYGISPIYLASKTRMELGSGSGKGTSGGTVVYNVFNIGANDSAEGGAQNGYNYAKSQGWTSYKKAIIGGAEFIASGFMDNNQYTLYYERFNVLNGLENIGTHQYCTNVVNPATMANVNYWSYRDKKLVDSAFIFEIPVYKSMPAEKCPEVIEGNNNKYLDALSVRTDKEKFTIKSSDSKKYGIINDKDGVNLRSEASAKSTKLGTLPYKEATTILSSTKDADGNKWYKLKSSRGTGYVKAEYVDISYFNRFINKYTVEVPNDVTDLKVSYSRNLSTSTVTVTGKTDLQVGENTIKVKVKSSSGLVNTYYIYVTRAEAAKSLSSFKTTFSMPAPKPEPGDSDVSESPTREISDEPSKSNEPERQYDFKILSKSELAELLRQELAACESDEEESADSDIEVPEIAAPDGDEKQEKAEAEIVEPDGDEDDCYLVWNNVDGSDGYLVFYREKEEQFTEVNVGKLHYMNLKDLKPDTRYELLVVSYKVEGDEIIQSESSNMVMIQNNEIIVPDEQKTIE